MAKGKGKKPAAAMPGAQKKAKMAKAKGKKQAAATPEAQKKAKQKKLKKQQKAKNWTSTAQKTAGPPVSCSSAASIIEALTAALHERGFMYVSAAGDLLKKLSLTCPQHLRTFLTSNSHIFKLCGFQCSETVVLVHKTVTAEAQKAEAQQAEAEAQGAEGRPVLDRNRMIAALVADLQVEGILPVSKLGGIMLANRLGLPDSGSLKTLLSCYPDLFKLCGQRGRKCVVLACEAVPAVPTGETAHQDAGSAVPLGEAAQQWAGTAVPLGEAAQQWARTAAPLGVAAQQWAGTAVPLGETAQQCARTAVPLGVAAQQWAGTAVPLGVAAQQWAGTAVPLGETAQQWAGTKRAAAAPMWNQWADTKRSKLDAGRTEGGDQSIYNADGGREAPENVAVPPDHEGLALSSGYRYKRIRFGGGEQGPSGEGVGVGPFGGEHHPYNFMEASGAHPQLVVVQTEAEIEMAVGELLMAPVIAMDCEGQSLSRSGRLCLVQVATSTRTFVFDVVAMSKEGVQVLERSLGRVLDSPQIQKVIHDCRQDSAALWHQHKIKLANVFDTQAAFVNMERRRRTSKGMAQPLQTKLPGLNTLLDRYAPSLRNAHKERVAALMRSDPSLWARRPLPEQLLEYAAADVRGLLAVRAGILRDMQEVAEWECVAAGERYAALGRDPDVDSAPPVGAEEMPMAFDQQGRLVEVVAREEEVAEAAEAGTAAEPVVPGCSIPRSVSGAADIICLLPADIAADPRLTGAAVDGLLEVTLDVGRPPAAWFYPATRVALGAPERVVSQEDLSACVKTIGRFGQDNRAGVEGTLHRISALRNRHDEVVGLTFRVGRTVPGCSDLVRDALRREGNILLLGAPGSGKTTVVRDIAAELSQRYRTIVVDTSNEIGGDGDMPHPCLGQARRMQVRCLDEQDVTMIECVKNHSPEVIVVDEISRLKEARAARIIAQRGVRLIASAHGSLSSAIQDELISDLLGGADHVTVGDRAARLFGGQKIRQQRKHASIFQTVIELSDHHTWTVFQNVEEQLDKILGGQPYEAQVRRRDPETGRMLVRTEFRRRAQMDKPVAPC